MRIMPVRRGSLKFVRPLRQLAQTAQNTPASRDRYIDLLRALAITLVVLGHWLITAIGFDAHHRPTGHSALESLTWAYPITWIVQVMPVFFIVGGYSNAASLQAHRRRGGDAVDWLLDRAARLIRPTTVLLVVLAGVALTARLLGMDPAVVRTAVWVASLPLWFLSAYLAVVLLTPIMYALHRRFGLGVPVVLVVLIALGDIARFAGAAFLAVGSYLFGWLVMHEVGFFWRDGRLRFTRWSWLPPLAGGAVALILLTVVGPYPITMIDVSHQRILNASPPTLALLATATLQLGIIMLLHDPAQRWLRRQRPWTVVVAANAVILTIFLWHMSAVLVIVGLLWWTNLLPTPQVGTAAWWLWRVPWLLILSVVLAALVAIFAPVEMRASRRSHLPPGLLSRWLGRTLAQPGVRVVLAVAGFAATVIGLLINNVASPTLPQPLGIPVSALITFLAGALVLRLLHAASQPPAER
jgi:peptidoglycan/LPS O-acetylase OafA/YrhL